MSAARLCPARHALPAGLLFASSWQFAFEIQSSKGSFPSQGERQILPVKPSRSCNIRAQVDVDTLLGAHGQLRFAIFCVLIAAHPFAQNRQKRLCVVNQCSVMPVRSLLNHLLTIHTCTDVALSQLAISPAVTACILALQGVRQSVS